MPATDPANLRPISLLPTLGKLFERCILKRLLDVIQPFQYGFRNDTCTTHQLVRIVDDVTNGFKRDRTTGLVAVDINKAYGRLWHQGLIYKWTNLAFP